MSKYDMFYVSSDVVAEKASPFSYNASTGFNASYGSFDFPVSAGSYGSLVGSYVAVAEGGKNTIYGRVVKTTSTTITVQPWESEASVREASAQTGFTTSATISGSTTPACTLSVDLTEATSGTYRYLILACANVSCDSASDDAEILLTANNKPGDHWSSDNGSWTKNRNHAAITFASGLHTFDTGDQTEYESYNWVASCTTTITPGELKEFNISMIPVTGTMYVKNSRIVAIRIPSSSLEDDEGTTSSIATEAAGSYTDALSLTSSSTQDYLIVCTGTISTNNVAHPVSLKLLNNATTLSEVTIQPSNTGDRIPFGFMFIDSVASGTDLKLQFKGNGSNTATISYSNLVMIPHGSADAQYGIDTEYTLSEDSTTEVNGTATEDWVELDQTSSIGSFSVQTKLRYLDVIGGTFYKSAGDTEIMVRPFFEGGVESNRLNRGSLFNDLTNATFWFNLSKFRVPSNQNLSVQARAGTDDTNTVNGRYFSYVRLAEREFPHPDEYKNVSIIADVQSGLYVKRWDAGSTTDIFQRRLVDISRVVRVIRNGNEMVKLLSAPSWGSEDEDTFYWDNSTNILEIKMPSGKNPESDDQNVVVVTVDTYGRMHEMLYELDSSGSEEYYSYDPLMDTVPTVQQELQVRSSGNTVATSIGSLKIASADNSLDENFLRRIYEGFDVHIRRGYSGVSANLADFETITVGTMGVPGLREDSVDIRVFDSGINLQNKLSDRSISVYQSNTVIANQILPVIFGTVLRVPAYRVTNNDGASQTNDFKICGHALTSIDAVYANSSDTDPLITSNGGLYPKSALIRLSIDDESAANGDDPDYNADGTYRSDVVYVDVVGLQFNASNQNEPNSGLVTIAWPGEMMKYFVQSYPREVNDSDDGIHQFTNTTTHTPDITNGNTISSASAANVARLSVGDIVKFEVSGGGNSYHAVVTSKPSSTSFHVHLQQFTGDNSSVSYNTSSTITLVERAGGCPDNCIDHDSFWRLDHFPHSKRGRLSGGKIIPPPPQIGHMFNGDQTVSEAMDIMARHSFTYWYVNRSGRIAAGVPDFESDQLLMNPGFENNGSSPAHWRMINLLSGREEHGNASMSASKQFEGQYAVQIDNSFGSFSKNPCSAFVQKISLPRSGKYCFTCVIAQVSGNFTSARVSILNPADNFKPFISEEVEISSNSWKRVSILLETEPGVAGTAYVAIHPTYPSIGESPPTFDSANMADWVSAEHPSSGWTPPEDGAEVATIYNKGTSGNNMTKQSTYAPRFVKNAYKGMPALRWDNSAGTARMAYLDTLNTALTVFVVYSLNNIDTALFGDAWRGTTSGDPLIIGNRNGNYRGYAGAELTGEALADNRYAPKIHTMKIDGATAEYFINGTSYGTNAYTDTITFVHIGGADNFGGDIFEYILYDSYLDAAEQQEVENYLMRKYGIGEATLLVDNAEIYPVGAELSGNKSQLNGLDFRDEIFSEASVSYNLNPADNQFGKRIIVTDSETAGLTSSISQGRAAIRSSSILVQADVRAADSASATGVAASEVNYYSRQRYVADIETIVDDDRLPKIGEKIFTGDFSRMPKDATKYPLLSIAKYEYDASNAKIIKLDGEGRIDSRYDRDEVTGAEVPVGAIVMTTSASTPTDYEEVPELKGWFLVGADFAFGAANMNTLHGNYSHSHNLGHTHPIGGHTHTAVVSSTGNIYSSQYALPSQGFVGPLIAQARGVDGTGHLHFSGSGSTPTSQTSSGESSGESTTLTSLAGDNIPTHIRVRFLRRKQNTVENIPDYLIFGFEKNSTPSNWSRDTSLDGYYIRGATENASFSGRSLTASFTPSESGSWLTLSDWSGISIGSTLTVTESSNTVHVIAIWPDPANDRWYVFPLHSNGDTPNSTSYTTSAVCAIGNSSSGVAETEGTAYTAISHDHSDTVGAHTHTFEHTHPINMNHIMGAPSGTFNTTGQSDEPIQSAGSSHTHPVGDVTLPSTNTASGSATGSSFSNEGHAPPAYAMVFMKPDGTVAEVPAGGIIFWAGSEPPPGYTRLEQADGLLIKGAAASADAGPVGSEHTHSFTAAAHTASHNHGSSFSALSGYAIQSGNTKYWFGSSPDLDVVADKNHNHSVTIGSISTTDPNLTARVSTSGASTDSKPYYKKIMICRRG